MSHTSTSTESLNVLLTALHPCPECCVDTEEYGTFVLQGARLESNGSIRLNVGSLSTLRYTQRSSIDANRSHQGNLPNTDTIEWKRVSLWSPALDKIKVAQTIQGTRDLKERLQETLDNEERNLIRRERCDPLHAFLKCGRVVFEELLGALGTAKYERGPVLPPAGTSQHGWESHHLMELHNQLEAVKSKCFPDSIDLSADLSTLSLQTTDGAQRKHTLVLGLTKFCSNNHEITILQCPVPQADSTDSHDMKRLRRDPKSATETADVPRTVSEFIGDFEDLVENCQDIWNQLDDLDANTWVLLQDTTSNNRTSCQRRICLKAPQQGDVEDESTMDQPTTIVLSLDPKCPRRRPAKKIHILGGSLDSRTQRTNEFDAYQWNNALMVRENLENCFGRASLTRPALSDDKKNDTAPTTDCGICFLECTAVVGTAAFSPCENSKCARPYHASCLFKWLSSKPTSRTSFDYVLGECPYCKDPIAAQQPEQDDEF